MAAAARSLVKRQNNIISYWNDWKQACDQVLGGLCLFVWRWFLSSRGCYEHREQREQTEMWKCPLTSRNSSGGALKQAFASRMYHLLKGIKPTLMSCEKNNKKKTKTNGQINLCYDKRRFLLADQTLRWQSALGCNNRGSFQSSPCVRLQFTWLTRTLNYPKSVLSFDPYQPRSDSSC